MKRFLVAFMGVTVLGLISAGILFAVDAPTDPITLSIEGESRAMVAQFKHDKHQDYACTDCHHTYTPDANGEYPKDKRGQYETLPENTWTQDQAVQECKECHKLETDKKQKKEMLVGVTMVRSIEDAGHDNCQDCHKAHNKENKLKKGDEGWAPDKCNDCHESSK